MRIVYAIRKGGNIKTVNNLAIKNIARYYSDYSLYCRRLQLHEVKEEIREMRNDLGPLPKRIVITIGGTPRSGKSTCVNNLIGYFKKANFKTVKLLEPAEVITDTLKNADEKLALLKDRVGYVERQYTVGNDLIDKNISGSEILIADRGYLDTFVWYDLYHNMGLMSDEQYLKVLGKLRYNSSYDSSYIALYTSPFESMARDYDNSLNVEERTTFNEEMVAKYNSSLLYVHPLITDVVDEATFIDTTVCGKMDASFSIAEKICKKIKSIYTNGR